MEEIVKAIILGVIQGLTEFIPVSSTAHLRVIPALLGWKDIGAAYSAVIQIGTLVATLIYFKKDITGLLTGFKEALKKKDFVTEIFPVETNIIIFGVRQPWTAQSLVEKLKESDILGHPISPTQVRLVTHLDVTPVMVEKTIDVITKL